VAGRFDPVLDSHNRFYPPGRLSRMDDKLLVFSRRNQVVVYWGYEVDQGWRTDPVVYQGVNTRDGMVRRGQSMFRFLAGMITGSALTAVLPTLGRSTPPSRSPECCGVAVGVAGRGSQVFAVGSLVFC